MWCHVFLFWIIYHVWPRGIFEKLDKLRKEQTVTHGTVQCLFILTLCCCDLLWARIHALLYLLQMATLQLDNFFSLFVNSVFSVLGIDSSKMYCLVCAPCLNFACTFQSGSIAHPSRGTDFTKLLRGRTRLLVFIFHRLFSHVLKALSPLSLLILSPVP